MPDTAFAQFKFPPAIEKALAEHDGALVHHKNEIDYLRATTDRMMNQFAAYAAKTDVELERLRNALTGAVHG